MKAILQTIVWLANALLAIVFFISCFTQFIPSGVFSYAVFFALLFPYLFLLVFCFAIINLFFNKKWSLFFFLLLIPGLYNFFHVVAVSPFSKWQMKKDTSAIRIMTWNVSGFVNPAPLVLPDAIERKEMLQTISEYNPDIICIQEYYNADSSRDLPSEKHELDSIGYPYLLYS
ncbi:MAG: endonuclease/exonuclease/phosphatase family protein, partial [Bacteroidota bacterium]|nr:endonuclease/exonuclease/phosphatase family protein [Bacteroidota bacterium]